MYRLFIYTALGVIAQEQDTTSLEYEYKYHRLSSIVSIGFILPNNSSDYYTTRGVSSLNVDAGVMHTYNLSCRFAVGGTFHYSYYNYKLKNANEDPFFNIGDITFTKSDVKKQVYRSHNIAQGIFTRYCLTPFNNHWNNDLYIDLGVQGDLAFSKYYKLKYPNGGKDKYRNNDTFNTFTTSAIVRIGVNIKQKWWGDSSQPAIFFRYRFADAFNSRALPMDLPPITIGIVFLETQYPQKPQQVKRCCF